MMLRKVISSAFPAQRAKLFRVKSLPGNRRGLWDQTSSFRDKLELGALYFVGIFSFLGMALVFQIKALENDANPEIVQAAKLQRILESQSPTSSTPPDASPTKKDS
eukprot:1741037-Rhodomonas_salina.2